MRRRPESASWDRGCWAMALFEAHEDNEDQGRYREHQEDEMRAVKFDLPALGGSPPA